MVGESESESKKMGIVPLDRLGANSNCEMLSTGLGGVTGVPRGYAWGLVLAADCGVASSAFIVRSAWDFNPDGGGVTGVFMKPRGRLPRKVWFGLKCCRVVLSVLAQKSEYKEYKDRLRALRREDGKNNYCFGCWKGGRWLDAKVTNV